MLDFVRAIPIVLETRPDIEFFIGGDGHLRGEIEQYIDNNVLRDKIHFVGWIPHNELPEYLNNLKLLVLPSYTEGLPGILLEAMACGTLALATSVGGIPDVVKDGETGFILDNNLPECIAENIIRVLNHPNLGAIAMNARSLIEQEFSYEKALENYRSILASWTQFT